MTPTSVYVWKGKHATVDEVAGAVNISNIIVSQEFYDIPANTRKVIIINESKEPEEWWVPLGGQGSYSESSDDEEVAEMEPRLLHVLDPNISKTKVIEEISQFEQEDLMDEDCFILDCFNKVNKLYYLL